MGDNLNGIFANMIQGMGFIGCAPNRVYNMAPPDGGGVEATAEGTELTLHSAAAPLTALTLYGKSEQRTTTGAQLIDYNQLDDLSASIQILSGNEISVTALSDGVYRQLNQYKLGIENFVDKMVFVSGNISYNSNDENIPLCVVRLMNSAGETQRTYNINLGEFATLEFDNSTTNIVFVFCMNRDNNAHKGDTMTIQNLLVSAKEASWEPYTGGAPSPSPDYSQEIKSVGDSGTVNVTISDGGSQSQTLPVQTPNGLPGIPVDSDGNYTDANGQQWICDEVDFERGVYVQRVHVINAKNRSWNDSWNLVFPDETGKTHVFNVSTMEYAISQHAMSNVFFNGDIANSANVNVFTTVQGSGGIGVRVYSQLASTLEEWNAYINSHDVIFALALKEQNYVETPLSASELAAYAALRTYSPTTVVSNDAGAWMRVGYKVTPQPMTMLARKR